MYDMYVCMYVWIFSLFVVLFFSFFAFSPFHTLSLYFYIFLLFTSYYHTSERCGGQGYLAVNQFGEAIGGAHAGITAEGDNRVLWQKVTKEVRFCYCGY